MVRFASRARERGFVLVTAVGPNAQPITVVATGQVNGVGGYGSEARSITQTFLPVPPPGSPYDHLIVSYGPGFQLQQDDTLIGKFVVSSAADSATLVNY